MNSLVSAETAVEAPLSPVETLNLAFRDAKHLGKEQLKLLTGMPRKQLALAMKRYCKKRVFNYYQVKTEYRNDCKKYTKVPKQPAQAFSQVQETTIKLLNLTYSKTEAYDTEGILNITIRGVDGNDSVDDYPTKTAEHHAKIYELDNEIYVHKPEFITDVLRHMQREAAAKATLDLQDLQISAPSFQHMEDNLCLMIDRKKTEPGRRWCIKTEFRKPTGKIRDVELLPHGPLRIGHHIFKDRVEFYDTISSVLNEKPLMEVGELKRITNIPRFFLKKALKTVGTLKRTRTVYRLRNQDFMPPSDMAGVVFKRWQHVLETIDNVVMSAFDDNQYMSCRRLSYRSGLPRGLVMDSLQRISAKNRQLWSLKIKNCEKVLDAIRAATVEASEESIPAEQQYDGENVEPIGEQWCFDDNKHVASTKDVNQHVKAVTLDGCNDDELAAKTKNDLIEVKMEDIPLISNYVNIFDEQYEQNIHALEQVQSKTFKLNIMELVDMRVMNAFRGFRYRTLKELRKLTKLKNDRLLKSLARIARSTTKMWSLRAPFCKDPIEFWDPPKLTERCLNVMHEIDLYVAHCFKEDTYLKYADIEERTALSRAVLKACLRRIGRHCQNVWQLKPTSVEEYSEALMRQVKPKKLSDAEFKVMCAFQGEPYAKLLDIQQATELSYNQTEDALRRVGLKCKPMWSLNTTLNINSSET